MSCMQIRYWVAFANVYSAMQGVRHAGEKARSNYQVEELLSAPSMFDITRYCKFPCLNVSTESEEEIEGEEDLAILNVTRDWFNASKYDGFTKIGSGAFGNAYRALDRKTNQVVVIKELFFEYGNSTTARLRYTYELQGECMILKRLQIEGGKRASRLVKCFQNSAYGDKPKIVLEDAGDDVYKYLRKLYVASRPKSLDDWHFEKLKAAVWIIEESIKAVKYLASKRVMHRDLKPLNIAVKGRQVKLIDFGNAIHVAKEAPKLNNNDKLINVGSYEKYMYAPPEVRSFWKNKSYVGRETARAIMETAMFDNLKAFDLWSLGMSLLQLICGLGGSSSVDEKTVATEVGLANLDRAYNRNNFDHCFRGDVINKSGRAYKERALTLLEALLNPDPVKRYFPQTH
eukprot:TRINITY_DN9011_c0_g4_i1.p1 TRINITY_DN9011_c0_g4~~TRINITY_DN9011_c0_g4_i1.p1  ORF type:complete len:401 (+),score=59.34 TRINITY_DN9011_c0_g4_i1:63-1265(+)